MRNFFISFSILFCAICVPLSASPIQVPLNPSEFKKRGITLKYEEHGDTMVYITVTWMPKEPGEEGTRLDLLISGPRESEDPFENQIYQGINKPDKKGNHSMVFMISKSSLSRSVLIFRENQNVNYCLGLGELTKSDDPFSKKEPN